MATQNHLSLDKRPCKIAGHINVRTEREGDEDIGAADLTLSGIMLDRDELGELLGDSSAWRGLFNQRGKVFEPAFPQFAELKLKHSFEKCSASLWLGLGGDTDCERFSDVKLRKVTIVPMTGGLTAISLQLQFRPDGEQLSKIYGNLEHDAACSLRFGKIAEKAKDQPQLPLGDGPDTDASVGLDDAPGGSLN